MQMSIISEISFKGEQKIQIKTREFIDVRQIIIKTELVKRREFYIKFLLVF